MKGAQIGVTETMINRAFHMLDVRRIDVMYLFPTTDDASDFSAGRFDQALEMSPHLKDLFSDVSNIGHKRAGGTSFYCRGSRSRSKLKSVPVGGLFIDEYDEMVAENVPLARERLSGHEEKFEMNVSTPTIPEHGISVVYNSSSQFGFYIQCESCSHRQTLSWEDDGSGSVDWLGEDFKTATFQCKKCKKPWSHEHKINAVSKGGYERITGKDGDESVSVHIGQLYSPTITAHELVNEFLNADNEFKRTEFFNSKLGLPYVAKGAKLSLTEIKKSIRGGVHEQQTSVAATMGIDVGQNEDHRVEIAEWEAGGAIKKVIKTVICGWERLPSLVMQYNVACVIIDALPERAKSREFVRMFSGRAYMAFYPEGMKNLYTVDEKASTVNIHRTEAIDTVFARYRNDTLWLPMDMVQFERYAIELCSPTRIMKMNKQTGEPIARYVESTGTDHFAHASVYNEIAHEIAPISLNIASAQDEIHEPELEGVFMI